MYNETLEYIEQQEKAGGIYVIRPDSELNISKVEKNPEKLKEIYNIGRDTAGRHIEKIKVFLSSEEK